MSTYPRRLKQVSNETPNDVSVVRHQDVLVVHVLDVLLVRLYNVCCKPQMKHSEKSLWYVSITSQNYVVVTLSQQVPTTFSGYFVITSMWQVFTSHLSIKSNTKFSSLDYKLAELLIYLKATSYINNICNIICAGICIS